MQREVTLKFMSTMRLSVCLSPIFKCLISRRLADQIMRTLQSFAFVFEARLQPRTDSFFFFFFQDFVFFCVEIHNCQGLLVGMAMAICSEYRHRLSRAHA